MCFPSGVCGTLVEVEVLAQSQQDTR
jgi:hypothetical protein